MEYVVALVLATILLVSIPGPNVALIVAKSLQRGFRAGFYASLGTTAGVAVQLLLVIFSISTMVELAASALTIIKWAGVLYLIWLGIITWRAPASDLAAEQELPAAAVFRRGLMIAVLNPKTLLFNAAFLPQFVSGQNAAAEQLLLLSFVYLSVLLLGDMLWALFASSARVWLVRYGRIRNRLTGALMMLAGLGLAMSRRAA